ncbi:hypothetical protein [Mycolicibacterium sp.]|uniref:hypothetical protein n=1 Tax=Mycolicibacterium sp. TaxID=2320850 RepID=UPI001D5AA6B5|nr:hypothetical protein [Mycolicibacterium sp.]MCB1290574.1 hypothetical protein [Mycobacterium sp.]MCB9407852.1 hypothetical protein [Mycolicibacterium sp.]
MVGKCAATPLTAAALAAGVLGTAGLGLAPSAGATCASLFGFSTDPARCTSSPLGIAVAIGAGAGARAAGLLGIAFAAGPDSVADNSGGALNVAVQLGANGTAVADGFLNIAASVSLGTTVPNGSEVRAQGGFGNIALNLFGDGTQPPDEGLSVIADGILNFAGNLGGADNAVLAGRNGDNGVLNAAVSMLGTGSNVVAGNGFLNAAAQFGGTGNRAFALNGTALAAAQLGGSGNAVYARNGSALAAAQMSGSDNQVDAQNGFLNGAAQFGGTGNVVIAANGAANSASQINGNYNTVRAGGDGADGYFTSAFSVLSSGRDALQRNTVLASPGPLAIAGSVGQDSAAVVQNGPGININRSSAAARRASAAAGSTQADRAIAATGGTGKASGGARASARR